MKIVRVVIAVAAVAMIAGAAKNATQDARTGGQVRGTVSPAGKTILVKPAIRNPGRWETARCNDGTPFAFELSLPTQKSRDWVIWLEGGGFCDDNATSCASGRGRLATTLPGNDAATITPSQIKGIFNRSTKENPTFAAANMVYAHYCSSDFWSGATDGRRPTTGDPALGWYFSGKTNVRAMLEALSAHYGLSDDDGGTRILFAGSSAGGVGVFVNADTIASLFPKSVAGARIKLVADGGGAEPDFDNPSYRPGAATIKARNVILAAYDFFGSRAHRGCEDGLRFAGKNPKTCLFGEVSYPYIKASGLPILVQSSSIDKFALTLHGIDNPKDPADQAVFEEYRMDSLTGFTSFSWLFSGGATSYHTILHGDGPKAFGMTPPAGPSFRDLLASFWRGDPPQRVLWGNP